jgi:hypothetical protein
MWDGFKKSRRYLFSFVRLYSSPKRAFVSCKGNAGRVDCWVQQSRHSIASGANRSMSSRIHPQARTTPKIREEIKDSGLSSREAAKVFDITRATARKWLGRDDVQDRSHRVHTPHAVSPVFSCAKASPAWKLSSRRPRAKRSHRKRLSRVTNRASSHRHQVPAPDAG